MFKNLVRAVIVFMPLSSWAIGPLSGGGGGAPAPIPCLQAEGNIDNGIYVSGIKMGLGDTNQLSIQPSEVILRLEQRGAGLQTLRFPPIVDRAGRIYGTAELPEGGCEVEIRITKMNCGSREAVRVDVPFWYSEYLWDTQKFGSCQGAIDHPDHVNTGFSDIWFE